MFGLQNLQLQAALKQNPAAQQALLQAQQQARLNTQTQNRANFPAQGRAPGPCPCACAWAARPASLHVPMGHALLGAYTHCIFEPPHRRALRSELHRLRFFFHGSNFRCQIPTKKDKNNV